SPAVLEASAVADGCGAGLSAEAMASWPTGAALKIPVSMFGQHSPIPTPTRISGRTMTHAPPPPAPNGIRKPSATSPPADTHGPTHMRRSATGLRRPELMKEPSVHPADISTIQ